MKVSIIMFVIVFGLYCALCEKRNKAQFDHFVWRYNTLKNIVVPPMKNVTKVELIHIKYKITIIII